VTLLFAIDRNLMLMYVISMLCAVLVLALGLGFLAAYFTGSARQAKAARRRQAVAAHLDEVLAQAEKEAAARSAAAKASAELTTVLPSISGDDRKPRHVA
jgi:uncharacterized protein HemX